jgi:hypothetical protein
MLRLTGARDTLTSLHLSHNDFTGYISTELGLLTLLFNVVRAALSVVGYEKVAVACKTHMRNTRLHLAPPNGQRNWGRIQLGGKFLVSLGFWADLRP